MTIAPHHDEIHRLVDQLTVQEAEALYVLLKSTVGGRETSGEELGEPDNWTLMPEAPVVRRLSVSGIGHGDRNLGRDAKDIVRRELGGNAS